MVYLIVAYYEGISSYNRGWISSPVMPKTLPTGVANLKCSPANKLAARTCVVFCNGDVCAYCAEGLYLVLSLFF